MGLPPFPAGLRGFLGGPLMGSALRMSRLAAFSPGCCGLLGGEFMSSPLCMPPPTSCPSNLSLLILILRCKSSGPSSRHDSLLALANDDQYPSHWKQWGLSSQTLQTGCHLLDRF